LEDLVCLFDVAIVVHWLIISFTWLKNLKGFCFLICTFCIAICAFMQYQSSCHICCTFYAIATLHVWVLFMMHWLVSFLWTFFTMLMVLVMLSIGWMFVLYETTNNLPLMVSVVLLVDLTIIWHLHAYQQVCV
jgi:hypothetical protein